MALNHSEVPVQNLKISIFLQYFNNILRIYIFAFHSASDCYLMSDWDTSTVRTICLQIKEINFLCQHEWEICAPVISTFYSTTQT